MSNLLVVGLDPGKYVSAEPLDPRYRSGRRLAKSMYMDDAQFLNRVDRINLYPLPGMDSTTDLVQGRHLAPLLAGRRVVALGRRVAKALGVSGDWMQWSRGSFVGSSIPHPSGLSRWWNDPTNVNAASRFLQNSLKPCVYVEGSDGAGKTTLIERLSYLTGLEVVPTDDPPKDWTECLKRINLRLRPGIICDRSSGLISELVYGPVMRGGTITDEKVMWGVVKSLIRSVVFVYCRPPDSEIRPEPRPGESPIHVAKVLDRLPGIIKRYDEVIAQLHREGARVVRYDRTRQTPEEVALWIQE